MSNHGCLRLMWRLVSDGRILIGGTSREIERYPQLADLDAELP